jgi:hypothetical protein
MAEEVKNDGRGEALKISVKEFFTNRAKELREEANTDATVADALMYGSMAMMAGADVGVASFSLEPTLVSSLAAKTFASEGIAGLTMLFGASIPELHRKKLPDGKGGNLKISTDVLPAFASMYEAIANKL